MWILICQLKNVAIYTLFFQFDQADLHPVMKENIRLAGYTQPTPVQVLVL